MRRLRAAWVYESFQHREQRGYGRVERAERDEKKEFRAQYGTIELLGGGMRVCESIT